MNLTADTCQVTSKFRPNTPKGLIRDRDLKTCTVCSTQELLSAGGETNEMDHVKQEVVTLLQRVEDLIKIAEQKANQVYEEEGWAAWASLSTRIEKTSEIVSLTLTEAGSVMKGERHRKT